MTSRDESETNGKSMPFAFTGLVAAAERGLTVIVGENLPQAPDTISGTRALPPRASPKVDEDRLRQPRGKFHDGGGSTPSSPSPLRRRPHCGNLIGLLLDTIHRGRASYHKRRDDAARRLPALRTAAMSRRVPPPRCIPLDSVVKTVSCQSRRRDPIMKFGLVFRRRRFATLLGITVYTPAPDLARNVSQTSARVRQRIWIVRLRLRVQRKSFQSRIFHIVVSEKVSSQGVSAWSHFSIVSTDIRAYPVTSCKISRSFNVSEIFSREIPLSRLDNVRLKCPPCVRDLYHTAAHSEGKPFPESGFVSQ